MSLIFDEQCSDLYPPEEIVAESEDGLINQTYPSFTQSVPETIFEVNAFVSSTLYADTVGRDLLESPFVSMPVSSQPSSQPGLPVIANRPSMQWMTSSINEIRSQSPSKLSSPFSTSSASSPSHKLRHQPSSTDSQSSATISHHLLTTVRQPAKTLEQNSPLTKPPTKPKGTPGRKRKFQDHELSPAEAARRHVRRERNKVAAAKCRNRRRELTDRLQGETDHLEDHQQMLQQEIIALEQEKQKLEYLLAHHAPNCKAGIVDEFNAIPSQINRAMTTVEPTLSPTSIPPYITNNLVSNLSEDYSAFFELDNRHSNLVQPASAAPSASSALVNSSYNLNRGFDPNYQCEVGSTSAFRPVNVSGFRRENMNALNSNIPPLVRNSAALCTTYFPESHEGTSNLTFKNAVSANRPVPFSNATTSFSAIPFDQSNLASQNFCSFDHRRQSVADCPCTGSVRSPKHLLAL